MLPLPPREMTCFAMVELIKAYFASDIKKYGFNIFLI